MYFTRDAVYAETEYRREMLRKAFVRSNRRRGPRQVSTLSIAMVRRPERNTEARKVA